MFSIAVAVIVGLVIAIALMTSAPTGLSADFPWQFRLAARLRTPILVFIVVPLSFIQWLYRYVIRYTIRAKMRGLESSRATHPDRVKVIQDAIKEWNESGRKKVMRTARPNWASMSTKLGSNKGDCHRIPTTHLNHILELDEENMTVKVEPLVNMGDITTFLVPKGYSLKIQVEMEDITIGGVSCGFGMETNSHTVGFFQETVKEYEIVTSDGKVITVNAENDPEVFYAFPWSCGTMGFLTAVTVEIARIKPYVHMHYLPTSSPKEMCQKLKDLAICDNPPYFLEATIYSKDLAVIQYGEFSDEPTEPEERKKINYVNYFWKPFYFKWVETFLSKDKWGGDEYIPHYHYFHRFTRSIFWEIEDMIPFSNHWLYRCLWGWMGAPQISLLKLFQGPVIRKASVHAHVVQETICPIDDLEEAIYKFDEWFCVYPLLVFPLKVYDRGELSGFLTPRKDKLAPGKDWGIWVDLGAYGVPPPVKEGQVWDAQKVVRDFEKWTRDCGGFQSYYTDMFCTRNEFRKMFNHTLLDKCRKRLNAMDAFPDVFDKMKPEPGLVDYDRIEREGEHL